MRTFAIVHILLVLILLLITQIVWGQDYLVTTNSDTLNGEIRPLMFGPEKKVQVKTDGGKEVYSITETKVFALDGVSYYPIKGPYGYTFMQLVKSGYLSLYRFQPENSNIYSASFLRKADGDGIEMPNIGFRKQMKEFLADCGDISDRIESGELKKSDIDAIIDEYNACIERRSQNVREEIQEHVETKSSLTLWNELETAIEKEGDFEKRETALEIVSDIQNRVRRGEKIPNFIIEGLKDAVGGRRDLADPLEAALASLGQ
ncbi:MAG TPA: hypothetical protein VF191_05905 [Cyclobacteriaceae bacterium]